jgi:hypothetical protein
VPEAAALERTRAETAVLRNLANAAALVSDNPSLIQVRILQVLSSGSGPGHTVVLGVPHTMVPIVKESG